MPGIKCWGNFGMVGQGWGDNLHLQKNILMTDELKKAIIDKFDDETNFTDKERVFIENNYKKSVAQYLADLITNGSTRLTKSLKNGVVVKHFTTDPYSTGINLIVLYNFYESNPLSKKFKQFTDAQEFYNEIINGIEDDELNTKSNIKKEP